MAPTHFIRKLPTKQTVQRLSLVDLVAGGDGTSNHRNLAIDPSTGRVTDTPLQCSRNHANYLKSDGAFHRVEGLTAVDGVFIPDGRYDAFPRRFRRPRFQGLSKNDRQIA